ncbi:MAG: tRNA modification enzyme, MiaB family [Dehalococcoidia bacterium]|nr:tRNA modification enzyme, MiaB family [Dehalococcoidia bacterium]
MNGNLQGNLRSVSIQTLGCKLNQAETELLTEDFAHNGYNLVTPESEADIYILNTCTVTHIADRKARHFLRMARRHHPNSFIVATGCYAQRSPKELEATGVVDLVVPQSVKSGLVNIIAGQHPSHLSLPTRSTGSGQASHFSTGRTRSFIKIQDGCHDGCAYCIVPQVRGRESSLPPDDIITRINSRVVQGYKEVVLTGTKIGGYQWDGLGLGGLVARILRETGVERLRLSSLQPQEITPELLTLWGDSRLCRHLHMPLQSGSDETLYRMRRRYHTEVFRQAVKTIRDAVPDMAITTDVIVGFPGESDSDFQNSLAFCQQIGFAAIHVFPYSPRQGTRAAGMMPKIDARDINIRGQNFRQLSQQSAMNYGGQFLGTTRPVLWENEVSSGVWSGLTDNYLRVFSHILQSSSRLANQVSVVRLTGLSDDGLLGEIVAQNLILTTG